MRPVFLNLFKIHMPISAIVSILHRLSGIFLFIGFPLLLYIYSLLPLAKEVSEFCDQLWVQVILFGMISAFCYHLIAGIRHLIFDFGPWHSQEAASISAWIVMLLSTGMSIWAAYLMWGGL